MDARWLRHFGLPIVLGCLVLHPASATAQGVSAELAAIFKWKSAILHADQYEIRGHRIVYNKAFELEKRSNIILQYDSPHSIRLEIQPLEFPKHETSHRKNPNTDNPYRLETEERTLLFWSSREFAVGTPGTGQHLNVPTELNPHHAQLHPSREDEGPRVPPPPSLPENPLPAWQACLMSAGKLYLRVVTGIPWNDPVEDTSDSELSDFSRRFGRAVSFVLLPEHALPSLFAADAPGFAGEFDWTVTRQTDTTIFLDGIPRRKYKANFQRLTVILDRKTGRPRAQKTIDPSGNLETVYVFHEWNTSRIPWSFNRERKQWDYEVMPLPPDFPLLNHRRKK